MYRLRTPGDFIFFLVVSGAVFALGIAMLLSPVPPMPTESSAYDRVSGTLAGFEERRSRRSHRLEFTLQSDPRRFESRYVPFESVARVWQSGVTPVSFYVLRPPADAGVPKLPVEVFALADDQRTHGRLQAEVAHVNQRIAPWGYWLPLVIGALGFVVAPLAWRRRGAA
jgi:hypothetical protein